MSSNGLAVVLTDAVTGLPYNAGSGGGGGGGGAVTAVAGAFATGSIVDITTTNSNLQTINTTLGGLLKAGQSVVLAAGSAAIGTVSLTGTLPAFAATPTFNIGTAPAIVLAAGAAAIGTVSLTGTLPAFAATPTFNLGTSPTLVVQGVANGVPQPVLTPGNQYTDEGAITPAANAAKVNFASHDTGVSPGAAGVFGSRCPFSFFYAECTSNVAGTLTVESCNDNASWVTSASVAVTPGPATNLKVNISKRYYRACYTNGATASAFTDVTTAFTSA